MCFFVFTTKKVKSNFSTSHLHRGLQELLHCISCNDSELFRSMVSSQFPPLGHLAPLQLLAQQSHTGRSGG